MVASNVCYDGAMVGTLSDKPQLLVVNLARCNGSAALKGYCLVEMLLQPDLLSVEGHFIASGWQGLSVVGVADREPGDSSESLMLRSHVFRRTALQHDSRIPGWFSDPPVVHQVSTASDSPLAAEAAMDFALTLPSRALDSYPAPFVPTHVIHHSWPAAETFCRMSIMYPLTPAPSFSEVQKLAGKGRLHTTDDGIVLLARKPTPPPPSSSQRPARRAACWLNHEPVRVYVPLLMRPWVMQRTHARLPFYGFLSRALCE